jgi:hypothetical protein
MWAQYFSSRGERRPVIAYTEFYHLVSEGKVASVTLKGQNVTGALKAPATVEGKSISGFTTLLPAQEDRDLLPLLRGQKVEVTVKSEEQPFLVQILIAVLPWVLILGAWLWISRRAQGLLSKSPLAAITKGRTRRYEKEAQVAVKFDDVAGLKGAKQDLGEIVEFLKDPARVRRLRQDPDRTGGGGRGGRALLFHQRLGVHRAVRRGRGVARALAIRRGEEGGAVDRVHRRDRCHRPLARYGIRGRARRA